MILLLIIIQSLLAKGCCEGETWTHCPLECRNSPELGRCCSYNELCFGQGCISKGDAEHKIEELQKNVSSIKCDYYELLDSYAPCGEEGYSNQYGKKKCEDYRKSEPGYSDNNQKWLQAVRKCLQQSMTDFLKQNIDKKGTTSCSQIFDSGIAAHYDCFKQPDAGQKDVNFCSAFFSRDIGKIMIDGWGGVLPLLPTIIKLSLECSKSSGLIIKQLAIEN